MITPAELNYLVERLPSQRGTFQGNRYRMVRAPRMVKAARYPSPEFFEPLEAQTVEFVLREVDLEGCQAWAWCFGDLIVKVVL